MRSRSVLNSVISQFTSTQLSSKGKKRRRYGLETLENRLVLAAPVAVNDSYSTIESAPINTPTPGVLANDTDADGDPISAVLVDNVDSGSLTLQSDGSFLYQPNGGFFGVDTFQYKLQSLPAISMTIDQSLSNVTADATLITELGERDATDTTRVSGTISTRVTPNTSPFSTAQVTAMNMTLVDQLTFVFAYPGATLTADAAPGAVTVSLVQPGAAAPVTAGAFTQVGNNLGVAGSANLSCNGFLCGLVTLPPNPQTFDTDGVITDFNGELSQVGQTVNLRLPINFTGEFPLDDTGTRSLRLHLVGEIRASGQVASIEESNVATVFLNSVERIDSRPDTYRVAEDGTLETTAAAPLVDEMLVPRGSLWRYLDTGVDPGPTWKNIAFNDSSWDGPHEAELGYGDGGEGMVIDCDPTPGDPCVETPNRDDNFITTYFRRDIKLDHADIYNLLVRLRRDDGAVVYVNGVEVVRSNLPVGSTHTTVAADAADDGNDFHEFTVPAHMLVVGKNVIAVEVHQSSAGSSDVSFDLELIARRNVRGVLDNDLNNVGGPLVAGLTGMPRNGEVQLRPNGSFTYTPDANFAGSDSFTYLAAEAPTPIPRGAMWTYLDNGSNQGTDWTETEFDDSTWAVGRGEFGYGDGGEETVIDCSAAAPGVCTDNYITTYFRQLFEVNPAQYTRPLTLHVIRDDGIAVFLNGVEIGRDNLAAGAAFDTPAITAITGTGETTPVTFSIPANMLAPGLNVLAVEVHQSAANSSDVSFDAWLTPAPSAAGPETVSITVVGVDDAPVARADGPYAATVGTPLVIAAPGVLANDTDVENHALSAVVVMPPVNGTLTPNANGGFEYTATSAGSDSFTYRAVQNTTVVPFGANWRIKDDGTDQGTAWQAIAFGDSSWSTGVGELGYGDTAGGVSPEATLVRYGLSQSNKYITTYFRHSFDVADAAALSELVVRAVRDDGIAVYINGTEIGRDNLAAAAIFTTVATASMDGAFETTPVVFNVPAGVIVTGRNTIAVEIHQAAPGSSDISFDLELAGKLSSAPATVSIESTGGDPAPQVAGILVSGSAWTHEFKNYLFDNGLGAGGFALPTIPPPSPIPWNNLDHLHLNFTELVDPGSLTASLSGETSGDIALGAPMVSLGPGGTSFAIWPLASGVLRADRYTFTLDAATTGGTALDGEWPTPTNTFPSGDGTAGGTFEFEFSVNPGDANLDGDVNRADLAASVASQFSNTATASYSPYRDIDGNGVVNYIDLIHVRNNIPASGDSPAPSAVVASRRDVSAANRSNLSARSRRGTAVDRALSETVGEIVNSKSMRRIAAVRNPTT